MAKRNSSVQRRPRLRLCHCQNLGIFFGPTQQLLSPQVSGNVMSVMSVMLISCLDLGFSRRMHRLSEVISFQRHRAWVFASFQLCSLACGTPD